MTCEERREEYLLDAIGALEPEESADLRAHLATGCVACAASAAEALAVAANYASRLQPMQPDPSVQDRLMARVNDSMPARQTANTSSAPHEMRYGGRRWLAPIATGAIAALLAAAVTAGVMWPQTRDQRLLKTSDLRYVSLAGSTPQPKAHGRIFWDADRGYWHVYVFDLTPPPPGKTYELWFIGSDQRKTRAGLFDVSDRGDANLVVQVPGGLGPLAAAAVTDENLGGADQPTGTIQLLGKIQ
jgi:anti-sigma-K factor RskA